MSDMSLRNAEVNIISFVLMQPCWGDYSWTPRVQDLFFEGEIGLQSKVWNYLGRTWKTQTWGADTSRQDKQWNIQYCCFTKLRGQALWMASNINESNKGFWLWKVIIGWLKYACPVFREKWHKPFCFAEWICFSRQSVSQWTTSK